MQTNNTDDNDNDNNHDKLTEEAQMIDKFQYTPFKEEVIKFEECPNEGKSSVELYNVVGVNKEDYKFQDVEVVDSYEEGKTEGNDDDDDNDNKNVRFGSEEENGGERNLCEIEIESEDEEGGEREIGIMDDWEEIGRKDFEELLGNKAGFYNVEVDYEK
ncbi:protein PFC0760c-like [Chenopodium quinoa]|nr:protein PFC0760c-like [Chenopodium quinoa]